MNKFTTLVRICQYFFFNLSPKIYFGLKFNFIRFKMKPYILANSGVMISNMTIVFPNSGPKYLNKTISVPNFVFLLLEILYSDKFEGSDIKYNNLFSIYYFDLFCLLKVENLYDVDIFRIISPGLFYKINVLKEETCVKPVLESLFQ